MARQKKWRFEKAQFEMLEFMGDRNQARKLYENENRQRKGFSTTKPCCKNKNGDLITNKEEVLMQWEDFFKELLNGNESRTSPQGNQLQKFKNNENVHPSTRAEVDKAGVLRRSAAAEVAEWQKKKLSSFFELYSYKRHSKNIFSRRCHFQE